MLAASPVSISLKVSLDIGVRLLREHPVLSAMHLAPDAVCAASLFVLAKDAFLSTCDQMTAVTCI
jgi:hypothetical protein